MTAVWADWTQSGSCRVEKGLHANNYLLLNLEWNGMPSQPDAEAWQVTWQSTALLPQLRPDTPVQDPFSRHISRISVHLVT
jgi:hypothetical protein